MKLFELIVCFALRSLICTSLNLVHCVALALGGTLLYNFTHFPPLFPLPSATEVLRHLVDGVESVELGGLLALHHLPLALEGRQLYVLLCLLGPWLE